jgi:hypothetical protein
VRDLPSRRDAAQRKFDRTRASWSTGRGRLKAGRQGVECPNMQFFEMMRKYINRYIRETIVIPAEAKRRAGI